MRICMMTNTYLPHVGGVARSVHAFSEKYRERGHQTLVVAPAYSQAKKNGPGVVRLPAIPNFNGSDFSVRLPIPGFLHDAIMELQPVLVHSHHPFLIGDTAVRVARQWGVPLVFTHHTLYERYTHYVPFDSSAMRDLAIKLATSYANLCSLVVAPSESIAELLRQRGVESQIEVVPSGVDVEFFRHGERQRGRSRYNISSDKFVIGHVGRLAHEKNLDFLSRAVAEALARDDGKGVFLVVGDGKAKEQIMDNFNARGLRHRLIFTGKLTGDELAEAYRAMDLFAFASTSETQGMVIAEAMAASLPVVALDATGVRELVEDEVNGRLLDSSASIEEFAGVLDSLASSRARDKLRDMAAAALETARRYDEDKCVELMLGHYDRLLQNSEGSASPGSKPQEKWKRIVNGLAAEWELITEKANALSSQVSEEDSSFKKAAH